MSSTTSVREKHYIIYSKKKNAIWGDPFRSASEAQMELNRQMSSYSPEKKALMDWKVMEMEHWTKKSVIDERADQELARLGK